MQLNSFSDYACRVLIFAAVRGDQRCTSDDIAQAFSISRHHLVKVVNRLQHLGYLETRRGRAGGFRLAQAPEQIRIGDVVRRTEATLALVECFDGTTNTCPLTRRCGLKGVLREAFDAFFSVLDRYTLADLVAQPRWAAQVVSMLPPVRSSGASRTSVQQ